MVLLEQPALKGHKEILAQQAPKACKVFKVNWVQLEHRAQRGLQVHKVLPDLQVHKGFRGRPDLLARRVRRGQPDLLVRKAPQETPAPPALRVSKEFKEYKAILDLQDRLDLRVSKDLLELLALRVLKERQDQRAQLALQAQPGMWAQPAQLVLLVLLVRRDPLVNLVGRHLTTSLMME